MNDKPKSPRSWNARIANPVAGWVAIFFLPAMLAFVAVASGWLNDWLPIIPTAWGIVAFSSFCMGYILIGYFLTRLAERGSSSSSGTATQDAPAKIQ